MLTLLFAGCLRGDELEDAWQALDDPESLPGCDPSITGSVSEGAFFDVTCIPDGEFVMGSAAGAFGSGTDEALHRVRITGSFWLGVTELSVEQYESITGSLAPGSGDCADCPVGSVDWHAALGVANAVSDALLLPRCYDCEDGSCSLDDAYATPAACSGYRLPTEAEWEYAAGATERGSLAGSGATLTEDQDGCAGTEALDDGTAVGDLAWYCGNTEEEVQGTGGRVANAWSLRDMSGNAREWVADAYVEAPPGGDDPFTSEADADQAVLRGGGCSEAPSALRVASRVASDRTTRDACTGLRLARTAGP